MAGTRGEPWACRPPRLAPRPGHARAQHDDLVRRRPIEILGSGRTGRDRGTELPFLLKVLAAAEPLSASVPD